MGVCNGDKMTKITKKITKKEEKEVDVDLPRYAHNSFGERGTIEKISKTELSENSDKLKITTIEYHYEDGYTLNIKEKSRNLGINFDYYIGRDSSQEYNKEKYRERMFELVDLIENEVYPI